MSVFKLFDCDMVVPCDTFQCFGRAKYFIGKEDAPKSTLTKVCESCAQELKESIIHPPIESLPFTDEPPKEMFFDKPVSDWTVYELREKATVLGIQGVTRKNKAELIRSIEDTFI